jgi:dTDP-4-dehydrorhamnose 3,5-epimerase
VRVIETELAGVLVLEPVVHRDGRGFFVETYHAEHLAAAGIQVAFVQANHSRSAKNTLRGLHWQWRRPQAKLVRVTRGAIFDVAVDVRPDSPRFGQWVGVLLDDDTLRQTFVPAGFAHGFCVISDVADVEYLCSDFYDPGGEAGLPWNDHGVGVRWPISSPILSERDRQFGSLDPTRGDLPHFGGIPEEGIG